MRTRRRWLLSIVGIAALVAAALFIYPPGRIELNRRRADADSSLRAIESVRNELPGIDTTADRDTTFQPGTFGQLTPENTAFVHAEDLADLSADSPIAFRFCSTDLKRAAFLVRNGHFPHQTRLSPLLDTPAIIGATVDRIASLQYLVVIQERRYDAPKLLENGEFESGYYAGEALFFEVPSRKLLGRFWIEASNGFLVKSREIGQNALLGDLGDNARKNLDGEVTSRFPAFANESSRAYAPCSEF